MIAILFNEQESFHFGSIIHVHIHVIQASLVYRMFISKNNITARYTLLEFNLIES